MQLPHTNRLYISGDFNAHTARMQAWEQSAPIHERDGFSIDNSSDIAGESHVELARKGFPFLPRWSEDNKIDKYGRYLLDWCKNSSLHILNGSSQRLYAHS